MRRVVRKLKNTVLILLILLVTSAIALTVVPKWKHLFFNNKKTQETIVDTISQLPEYMPQTTIQHDTLPIRDTARIPHIKRIDTSGILPPFDLLKMLGLNEPPDPLQTLPIDNKITLSYDGTQLTIIGAEGELIRLYDKRGKLVAVQKADDTCNIQLDRYASPLYYYECTLHIGDRSPLTLRL